jgi:L-ascorbate metabolism protein UlaG (beta-lactamase superfamily)
MSDRYTSPKITLKTVLRWQLSRHFGKPRVPEKLLPIERRAELPEGEYALWLGHASVWMNIGGTTVAIDPVLGDIPVHRRHTPLPLPREILRADLILITHAHYDHFDKPSVLELLRRNPDTIVVAPQGFWRYLKGYIARERCFELERWESVMIGGLFITLTPSRHWSKRTLFDTNKALWGGYVIQNSGHTLYHAGDTAYGEHFKEIAERFEIDEAFLPIGAYRPEIIMKHNHMNPPEAIRAFGDLGAKTLIPVHYGTFRLSDEPLDEPLEWFTRLMGRSENPDGARGLRIGEVYRFSTTSTARST